MPDQQDLFQNVKADGWGADKEIKAFLNDLLEEVRLQRELLERIETRLDRIEKDRFAEFKAVIERLNETGEEDQKGRDDTF